MGYLHEFGPDDIFVNGLGTHAEYNLSFYSGSAWVNDRRFTGRNISTGSINLYEMNVDRESDLIYPFIIKDGYNWTFKSITTASYDASEYGTVLTGAYPYTASVEREYIPYHAVPTPNSTDAEKRAYFIARKKVIALRNTLNYYKFLSDRYDYEDYFQSVTVNMVQIPSIYYDAHLKKGTVDLKLYYTGTLVDQLKDSYQNGELISQMGSDSGTCQGVVLYNEGFVLLTGSNKLGPLTDAYLGGGAGYDFPRWVYYNAYSSASVDNATYPSATLYTMDFKGTSEIPVMTMFANIQPGELNNSQNPTWISSSNGAWREKVSYDSGTFAEPIQMPIKNTIQSLYCDYEDQFEKQVFISEIGIFDKDKNLIGVAKVANPVLKKETDQYTFKLKIDL